MKWYLKREHGEIRGPVEVQQLCDWAERGDVSQADFVSTDRQVWIGAFELPDLQELTGKLPVDLKLMNPPEPVPDIEEEGGNGDGDLEAALDSDSFSPKLYDLRRELKTWKSLYDRDTARWARTNARLKDRIEKLEAESAANLGALEQARLELRRVRKNYDELRSVARLEPDELRRHSNAWTAEKITLQDACDKLTQSCDVLAKQLAEKTKEIEALELLRAEDKKDAERQAQAFKKRVAREHEIAESLRHRLAELERDYEQVAVMCRELNQQLIERNASAPSQAT